MKERRRILSEKIIMAVEYMDGGHPVKDVLDTSDIEAAIRILAEMIRNVSVTREECIEKYQR